MHLAIKMQIVWLYTVLKKSYYIPKMYKSLISTRLIVGRIQGYLTPKQPLFNMSNTLTTCFLIALSCFLHYLD